MATRALVMNEKSTFLPTCCLLGHNGSLAQLGIVLTAICQHPATGNGQQEALLPGHKFKEPSQQALGPPWSSYTLATLWDPGPRARSQGKPQHARLLMDPHGHWSMHDPSGEHRVGP